MTTTATNSDSNRVAVGIVEEAILGVTPANPAVEAVSITGTPSLAFTPTTTVSNSIRPDRQVTDLILVGAEPGGDFGFEVSVENPSKLVRAALFND